MTRPQIIRADTIDLQDPEAPSAKDHTRQPTTPGALGEGPPAPHQANALKTAGLDGIELKSRSPRASQDLSGKEIQLLQNHDETEHPQEATLEDHGAGSQDSDIDDEIDEGLEDDMMDKISSSPSIDDEDIDFEFVYALHTFVATVEGQANATKGDTMVLLDDSNSYWWLVRIVKDSSIGYLPAEHIETPTERLARLNKHRNIDLSQTMLGDNTEKSRSNPLRKARKRRNAKTVQFTEPTYYEPSEHEYSSDEDASPDDMEFVTTADAAHGESDQEQAKEVKSTIEPAKVQETPRENGHEDRHIAETAAGVTGVGALAGAATVAATSGTNETADNTARLSNGSTDDDAPAVKTRIRNTDSFYKDDSIETKKINLTPSLLREDKAPANTGGLLQATRARSSSESTTKSNNSEKPPEKKKEKKSVLGRLFKVKNSKKAQAEEEAEEWIAKDLTEKPSSRSSADNASLDTGTSSATVSTKGQPSRTGSKLTKAQPQKSNSINKGSKGPALAPLAEPTVTAPQLEVAPTISPITNPFADNNEASTQSGPYAPRTAGTDTANTAAGISRAPSESKSRNLFSPIRDVLGKPDVPVDTRVEKVKKAPTREPIEIPDDSDTYITQTRTVPHDTTQDRLSESPVHVEAPKDVNHAYHSQPRVTEGSRGIAGLSSAASSSSTPELIERPSQEMAASNASTVESSAPSSKKDNFDWPRLDKWFKEEFNDWFTCVTDVSDEMENFDWKKHWAHQFCKDLTETNTGVLEELDFTLVDYFDIESRKQEGRPPMHPPYRQVGWELQWMRYEHLCLQEGKSPEWLPWNDTEYSYLYPHRPSPKGAASGPPAGYEPRPSRDLRIIGPAALSMNLDDSKLARFSPYPEPPPLSDFQRERVQIEVRDTLKA